MSTLFRRESSMKTLQRFAMFTILFLIPSTGYGSYRILLNNGSEFITERYRESEGQIVFDHEGDTIALPRSMVKIVDESGLPVPVAPKSGKSDANSLAQEEPRSAGKEPVPHENKAGDEEAFDLQAYKKQNEELKANLKAALGQLKASSRRRDEAGKERARIELREVSRRIYDLTDELKHKSGGNLPEDWWSGVGGPAGDGSL